MNKEQAIQYWVTSANDDWQVALHFFEKGDYSYSLFLAHLTIEKYLKAIYVDRVEKNPPYTHIGCFSWLKKPALTFRKRM